MIAVTYLLCCLVISNGKITKFRGSIVYNDKLSNIFPLHHPPVIERTSFQMNIQRGTFRSNNFHLLEIKAASNRNYRTSLRDTVTASATDRKPVKPTGNASLTTSFTNLLKNCVGAGVFSLNYRVSAISSTPRDLVYVAGLVFIMAMWAAYNFFIIGETCKISESRTIGEAWSKTVSPSSSWIVQTAITVAPMVGSLANTIVLTDILTLTLRVAGVPQAIVGKREAVLALLISLVLFPICSVKDLSGLKSTSTLGLSGHFAAMFAIFLRVKDGSYSPGGKFFTSSALASTLASPVKVAAQGPAKWFVLASLLSYCYVTHYNAPHYYNELGDQEKKPFQFLKLAFLTYSAAAVVYFSTIFLALTLFGPGSASFALNSFSPKDPLAVFSLLAFGTSVLASFPLMFLAMRSWFISKAGQSKSSLIRSVGNIPSMSALLLTCIGFLASKITDIGKVGSLSGAVFGSAMMFVFPPIMYIRALQRFPERSSGSTSKIQLKILFNVLLLLSGMSLGLLGTYNTVLSILSK